MAVVLISAPAYVVIGASGDFTVSTGQAASFNLTKTASVKVVGLDPVIYTVRHKIISAITANISIIGNAFSIRTSIRKVFDTVKPPKRSWQARLGSRMDTIYKKSMDNKISLGSYPVDMIRVEINRDARTQDLISRTITDNRIMPIYFTEPFDKLPLRRMKYADSENIIMTIDGTDLKEIIVKCPVSETLNRDDLLFRVLRDDYSERPVVLVLQVKEELGVIGYSKLLQIDYVLSYYDEKLPESVITAIIDSTEKREELQW